MSQGIAFPVSSEPSGCTRLEFKWTGGWPIRHGGEGMPAGVAKQRETNVIFLVRIRCGIQLLAVLPGKHDWSCVGSGSGVAEAPLGIVADPALAGCPIQLRLPPLRTPSPYFLGAVLSSELPETCLTREQAEAVTRPLEGKFRFEVEVG